MQKLLILLAFLVFSLSAIQASEATILCNKEHTQACQDAIIKELKRFGAVVTTSGHVSYGGSSVFHLADLTALTEVGTNGYTVHISFGQIMDRVQRSNTRDVGGYVNELVREYNRYHSHDESVSSYYYTVPGSSPPIATPAPAPATVPQSVTVGDSSPPDSTLDVVMKPAATVLDPLNRIPGSPKPVTISTAMHQAPGIHVDHRNINQHFLTPKTGHQSQVAAQPHFIDSNADVWTCALSGLHRRKHTDKNGKTQVHGHSETFVFKATVIQDIPGLHSMTSKCLIAVKK